MTVTNTIGRFIAGLNSDTIPPEALEKARTCLLNGYGIGLGSHPTPYAPIARKAVVSMDGELIDGATLLGDGRKVSMAGAMLANSALFHGRAQEDTCGAAHLGAIVIPLLTAMVEARKYPLDRLLPSLVAGYEVGGLLEKEYSGQTTPSGIRASTVYGVIAAAAAAARLMALDAERAAAAIANSASFSGGLLQSFADGTDEWRYQVGMVARNGFAAAELARSGSVSAPHAIEGPAGFVRVFTGRECDTSTLLEPLGRDWATMRVSFKPFPVCAFNQTPVLCALALRDELAERSIHSVEVRMNPYETGYAGMDSYGPFTTISGTLMSIPFCIAATLLYGPPAMHVMTTYDDQNINELLQSVKLISDPQVPTLSTHIKIKLNNGEILERYEQKVPTDYSYSWEQVSEMIRRIGVEVGLTPSTYDRLEGFLQSLPKSEISEVITCFNETRLEEALIN